ncbi:hypothetical protein [Pseudomonas sp. C5pp]|uniref:hypothetical protein n=1 Tax=Pseudomonas sp. C5pp TaxID=1586081 RepID=UPI000580A5DE|nr:hypothetical protein [Pseudomonas sp. C5pp]KIC82235.1 hypothetical protein RR51_12270 [Pseudomonas sp. C5pp]
MCAANAMAIYGIEKITPEFVYELGVRFFKIIGLDITTSGYYKYRKDRSGEDIDFVEVSLADLSREVKSGRATSFRLYCESENGFLWDASFGYSTTDFGGFYHIDAQGLPSSFGEEEFLEFIDGVCLFGSLDYAIFYSVDDVSEGLYYAGGENLISVYNYENLTLFSRGTGGRFKGVERYKNEMLRMVYPINVVNEGHLKLQVGPYSLRDWILSDSRHGVLKLSANDMWVWMVEGKNLEHVNKELGGESVLISWKSSRSSRRAKLLP